MEDGSLLLRVKCSEEALLLRIERNHEPLPQKQEITMASTYTGDYNLDSAVTKFNRTSERYYVTMQYPYDPYSVDSLDQARRQEDLETFQNRLQTEISVGRGPDLYYNMTEGGTLISWDMARGGYLRSLEWALEEDTEYWTAALEAGRIDDVLYGIPIHGQISMVAYPSDVTENRTSWTLPELMRAVRESGAEAFLWGYDGIRLVIRCGLYDNDNKDFIDWEKGESHLEEKAFREFLEFAREYADAFNDRPEQKKMADAVETGRVFAANPMAYGTITNWGMLDSMLSNIFPEGAACLGYPRSEGNGIYAAPSMIYMNVNSDKKDGIKEFLRFLLSKEIQRSLINEDGHIGWMPVRLDVLEESIETALARNERGETSRLDYSVLTREHAQAARFLIENAEPGRWKAAELEDILYEELEPYFQNKRSLEETVKILDNRVQLYLDERQ